MSAVRDQAEGLRRLGTADGVRCLALVGPPGCGVGTLGDAMASAWRQRGRGVALIEGRGRPASHRMPLPARPADLADWAAGETAHDVVIALVDPEETPWPCLAFDEFVVIASSDPGHLTFAYGQLKAIARTAGRPVCHVMLNRTSESAASQPLQNFQQTARRYLGCVPDLLGAVPADPLIGQATASGLDPVTDHPRSPAVRAIRSAVERLDGRPPAKLSWAGWTERLRRVTRTPIVDKA